MNRYNPKDIEPRWQQKWNESHIYQATEDLSKPKKYILEYFPYPSGAAMHVGHVRNYTIGDVLARYNRMAGYNVLHPMGWDAFGLPAENYAIKTGVSPRQAIDENTARFKEQLTQMGFSYDWSREIDSTDPKYYRWTQWFFLMLFKRGLAYQQESLQWWCPHDKTVLANEQVEAGKCWRCGNEVEKKSLKQWFFKITDYADRLAKDLDDVDWSDSIKSMQRNWIGRSKGAEITYKLDGHDSELTVFTTRPDTLFGATFMVLSPEHPLVKSITTDEQKQAVADYAKAAQAKSDIERQETNREKTGVFTGAYAINPVNGEKISVWIADYVLMGYGTGAIMAVPAHDERDYAFAKKFELPIIPVVAQDFGEPLPDAKQVEGVVVVVYDASTGKYLNLKNNNIKASWMVSGGREEGETFEQAAIRELAEEAGITEYEQIVQLGTPVYSYYYNDNKKSNRRSLGYNYLAIVNSQETGPTKHEAHEDFSVEWVDWDILVKKITDVKGGIEHWIDALDRAANYVDAMNEGDTWSDLPRSGEGVLINSGPYDGLPSSEAREKIVADLEAKKVGREVVNYKMRDWLISRQRYWGAPIPIIHCPKDGAVAVPDDQLPVVLPELDKFEPSGDGRSPLANVPEFVNTTCPTCGGPAKRETDTMDGFACSSWYFLRFADPHNDEKAFDPEKARFWLPVDDYIGGAEHAVMHLLYARMWTKVMYDEGLIDFKEPFKTLRNHGMILAPDGQKMSKSKGNTIEPGVLIDQGYGADSIRIMELFIGPWNQAANWSVEGMGGAFRFLQRIHKLVDDYSNGLMYKAPDAEGEPVRQLQTETNRVVKRVTKDIENMNFNTAIAALMEHVNVLYKQAYGQDNAVTFSYYPVIWLETLRNLCKLLAPFAPHLAEELWAALAAADDVSPRKDSHLSIHLSSWPAWDEKYLVEDTVTIVVQVNGKLRGEVTIERDASQETIVAAAQADEKVAPHLDGKPIRKTVYVPGRLVNFVV